MKIVILNSCARYKYVVKGVEIVDLAIKGEPTYSRELIRRDLSPSIDNIKETIQKFEEGDNRLKILFVETHRKGEIVESDSLKNAGITVLNKITDYKHTSDDGNIIFIDCTDSTTLIDTIIKFQINFDDTSLFKIWKEDEKIDLLKIIDRFDQGDESFFCTPFNPFKEFSIGYSNETEKKAYYSFVVTLTKMLITYLRIGFADGRILKIDNSQYDDWHFNFSIVPMKLFIDYFGLQPVFKDRFRFPIDQFCTDANYRKVITIHLTKLIANIFVANEWIKVSGNDKRWYDSEIYVDALKRIDV